MLYIVNIKCLTNIIQSGNAWRKIYFHLFCFWEFARKKKILCLCRLYYRGVWCASIYHYHRYTLCIYALHKWTEHIFVKWPTGNNGIHHEEKTWKFHIILRLIIKLAKIFEIYKYHNELICLITYWYFVENFILHKLMYIDRFKITF